MEGSVCKRDRSRRSSSLFCRSGPPFRSRGCSLPLLDVCSCPKDRVTETYVTVALSDVDPSLLGTHVLPYLGVPRSCFSGIPRTLDAKNGNGERGSQGPNYRDLTLMWHKSSPIKRVLVLTKVCVRKRSRDRDIGDIRRLTPSWWWRIRPSVGIESYTELLSVLFSDVQETVCWRGNQEP